MALRLSTTTKLTPQQVIDQAAHYFESDVGLVVAWRLPNAARFEGAGGHLQISAAPTTKGSEVELETMEWEYQVREFASKLPR